MRLTLVDRHNYHLFQPLLYQVASATLSPGDIASPIRSLLRRWPKVSVRLGEVTAVDVKRSRVLLADGGELAYDMLVLAAGVRHSYFGHPDWEPFAPGLKSLDDALEMRRRILLAFEQAETDPGARDELLTFVVVGGGPTGVELAGAIAEISRHVIPGDFRAYDPKRARILLLEAGPRILPGFSEDLSARAQRSLERLGVTVRCGCTVTSVGPAGVEAAAELIRARTILWAAGIEASPLAKSLGVPLDRAGRVLVDPDLSIPGHPEVFVIGDLAAFIQDGRPLPGLAPVAMQQGRAAAQNVIRTLCGAPRTPFHYKDRGIMATIGRAAGVAQRGRLHLSGFLGWAAWLFIHLLFLVGFRNKLLVLLQWAWDYWTYKHGVRLITGPPPALPSDVAQNRG
ncbi:MAG: NAD(P)/FAD-dependent oxidoreductase [Myxococcaceae bacterium]